MLRISKLGRRFLAFVPGLALVYGVVGCGDDSGIEARYKVSGTVTYKDAPVEAGNISFIPEDQAKGRGANGEISGGKYSLTTVDAGDGAVAGKYKVIVVAKNADYTQVKANAGGGSGRQDDVLKANAKAKSLIPAKYSDETKSGLTAEVKSGSNTFDFKLTD